MEKNIVIFVEPEETIDPTEFDADVEAIAMDCRAQEMARAAVNCL